MKEYLLIGKKENRWDIIKNYHNLDSNKIKNEILKNNNYERFFILEVERTSETQVDNAEVYREFLITENNKMIEKEIDNDLRNFIYNNIIFY